MHHASGQVFALVADDHHLYRAALADLLGRCPSITRVLEAASLEAALDLLQATGMGRDEARGAMGVAPTP